MDEMMTASPDPKTAAEYRAAIAAMTAEIRRMHAHMDANEEEFNRLKEASRLIKAETEEIKARIRRRLDDIQTWM